MDIRTPHEIEGRLVRFTAHAIGRLLDMQASPASIRAALVDPSSIKEDLKHPGHHYYAHGRLALVVAPDRIYPGCLAVLTALWRDKKRWDADLARGDYGGRTRMIPDYSDATLQSLLEEIQ